MTCTTETHIDVSPARSLADTLLTPIRHRLRRRDFNKLLNLDDRLLDDMGVSRAEVVMASYLPLSVNAAEELRRMSRERRRNRM